MEFERQQKIAQAFFDKYLPGQFLVGLSGTGDPSIKYLGIDAWAATFYAQALVRCIFTENPNITAKAFEKEMLSRIPVLHELSKAFAKSMLILKKFEADIALIGAADRVAKYFSYSSDLKLPFKEQVRSFKLTARFIPAWLKTKPKRIGNFTLHYDIWLHPETPLSVEIRSLGGNRVATLGGYLYYAAKQPIIRLTNVQGVGVRKRWSESEVVFEAKKRKNLQQYAELNKQLGENWRVFFTKQVVAIAERKGMPLVAELPRRFADIVELVSDSEYKRQLRQSRQTYRKAGLTE